jgi:two-component system cell cycle response regulator
MSSCKVLVAGGSRLFQETIPRVLSNAGLDVVGASDGLDAIERAAGHDVAIALLDVGLARMNGHQVCRLLKSEPSTRDLPVILLTASDEATTSAARQDNGADRYLPQDARPEDILDLVRTLLAERTLRAREPVPTIGGGRVDVLARVNSLLDRKLFEATLVSALGRLASDAVPFDDTFLAVMGTVAGAVDFTLGGMGFVEGDDLDLVLVLRRRAAPAAVDAARARMVEAALRARGGPFDRVVWRVIPPETTAPGPEDSVIPGLAAIPVSAGDRLAALLLLAGETTERLSAATRAFLDALASQARLVLENGRLSQRLKDLSIRDGLTGLFTHRHVLELVAQAVERADRYKEPVSLLLVDIDAFKAANEQDGRHGGDALLRELSRLVRDTVRSVDAVGRYGGDELLVLLPHTGYAEAMMTAERLRRRVHDHSFPVGDRSRRLTVSVGVFSCPSPLVASVADLVRETDRALDRAKAGGRNRVR